MAERDEQLLFDLQKIDEELEEKLEFRRNETETFITRTQNYLVNGDDDDTLNGNDNNNNSNEVYEEAEDVHISVVSESYNHYDDVPDDDNNARDEGRDDTLAAD